MRDFLAMKIASEQRLSLRLKLNKKQKEAPIAESLRYLSLL